MTRGTKKDGDKSQMRVSIVSYDLIKIVWFILLAYDNDKRGSSCKSMLIFGSHRQGYEDIRASILTPFLFLVTLHPNSLKSLHKDLEALDFGAGFFRDRCISPGRFVRFTTDKGHSCWIERHGRPEFLASMNAVDSRDSAPVPSLC
jgi:hypothetical protein